MSHHYFQLILNGLEGMAERVGFEPTLPCGKHAFQACAFSHSAISPQLVQPFDCNTVKPPAATLAAVCTSFGYESLALIGSIPKLKKPSVRFCAVPDVSRVGKRPGDAHLSHRVIHAANHKWDASM